MEYAVVEINKKQYKVENGLIVEVDKLPDSKDNAVFFDKVLLHMKDSEVALGKPYLSNIMIKGKIIETVKGDKIRVARFKAKARQRKVTGFRPIFSRIQIEEITTASKKENKTKKRA